MKKIALLLFISFIFFNIFALKINEFIVTPTSAEKIELYNDGSNPVDVTGYKLYIKGTSSTSSTTFKSYTISAGGYKAFDLGTAEFNDSIGLPNDGAIIIIKDNTDNLIDSVGYGDLGGAPSPIYNFSTARVDSTGDNALDFNMDFTPTMGSANDCPSNMLGNGTVFINEVYPSDSNDNSASVVEYIELYNNSNTPVDISNWVIVCDDDYYVPSGTSVPAYGYYVLYDSSFPQYFYLDAFRDNIYLYNNLGNRIDQVGWHNIPVDSSFSVIPNGVRTFFKGYDEITSVDFKIDKQTPAALNAIEEVLNKENTDKDVKVYSLSGIGIRIECEKDKSGSIEIIDNSGRVIYSSFLKNMIFSAKSGIYFVKVESEGKSSTYKVNLIK
uniref:T9SS type A sorting domain-containing protein n=1 Tax=candidate division WOR-3 bacterium TaxID=2052148 RepID=A0A7C3NEG4_UNCW3